MQAKSGPIPQRKVLSVITPPSAPSWLSDAQRNAWEELSNNPYLTRQDAGLMAQYIRTLALHEQAHQALVQDGIVISGYRNDPRVHPAYRIYQQTSVLLVTLRTALMATPAARIKALQTVALVDDQPEDELEID